MILDEAQAIKNATTESAKAARLLRGEHRLALSGTPIENHLGELWSLFEFLNPGMLGAASAFGADGPAAAEPRSPTRRPSSPAALRPFILRRTKEQVAQDLPREDRADAATASWSPPQRKLYDELRDHYRAALLGRVGRDGLGRSKIQVLEALLRLRQAACHPGLLDRARLGESSAKLDALLPRLAEVPRARAQGAGLLAVHELPRHRARGGSTRRASPTSTSTGRRATGRRGSSASRTTRTASSS